MADDKGAKGGGVNPNANDGSGLKQGQDGGGNDANAELENLKKDLAGRDTKIGELVKQNNDLMARIEGIEKATQAKELATKTVEEQLKAHQQKVKEYEQKETFRQAFKEQGLNPDDFAGIVNETNPALQAQKFSNLLSAQLKTNADKTLEEFKAKQREQIPEPPNPKDKPDNSDELLERAKRAALG